MFLWTEIRYQLFRNKGRSVLLILIAALLTSSMAFYLANIRSTETALQSISDNIPVTVRVVTRNGSKRDKLNLAAKGYDILEKAGVHDVRCTAAAAASYSQESRSQVSFYGGDTDILAANCKEALTLPEDVFTFAPGQDFSFLEGNEGLCVLDEEYAKSWGFELGDEFSLHLYTARWEDGSMTYKYRENESKTYQNMEVGEVTLTVAGFCSAVNAPAALVPVAWLREQAENAGVEFFYDSYNAILNDSQNLRGFKRAMLTSGYFMNVLLDSKDNDSGDSLSVEDELVVKTAGQLRKNLVLFRSFLIPFAVLLVGFILLITFLSLRGSRREMAVATSLGRTKKRTIALYFTSIMIVDLLGYVLAIPILSFGIGLPAGTIFLIGGLFLLCSGLGTMAALAFLLRFDAMELLTKTD